MCTFYTIHIGHIFSEHNIIDVLKKSELNTKMLTKYKTNIRNISQITAVNCGVRFAKKSKGVPHHTTEGAFLRDGTK